MNDKKVKIVCSECGSENVVFDAWAEWCSEGQKMVLRAHFDYNQCDDCGAENVAKEVEILA